MDAMEDPEVARFEVPFIHEGRAWLLRLEGAEVTLTVEPNDDEGGETLLFEGTWVGARLRGLTGVDGDLRAEIASMLRWMDEE